MSATAHFLSIYKLTSILVGQIKHFDKHLIEINIRSYKMEIDLNNKNIFTKA